MKEEFKKSFSNLPISEKNQISNELILIGEIIKNKEQVLNLPTLLQVKNYNDLTDDSLTESEMLDFIYEDIYNIQKELITLFTVDD